MQGVGEIALPETKPATEWIDDRPVQKSWPVTDQSILQESYTAARRGWPMRRCAICAQTSRRSKVAKRLQLYIDDLVTLHQFRRCDVAQALFGFVRGIAEIEDCRAVHLDSGYNRADAHRFCLKHGLGMTSHHFSAAREELR
jgi:hypothetical protein